MEEKQEIPVLFEHNEIAYSKLCEALKTQKCTTINHATGTGKSFIALKYLYNNRDKKFLYIAPTYPIIEQLKRACPKIGIKLEDMNFDTMIYRTLLTLNMRELFEKYDGIIFDEYHRTGAQLTYKKIKELKALLDESQVDKKFIGLTATPIRYLDNERNMTNEVFDGNVASYLPLADAMIDGLLPVPYYINTKITCRSQYYRTLRRVERFPEGKYKDEIKKKIAKVGKQIDNGIMDNKKIIKSYITNEGGKYIVFCSSIKELQKYYNEIPAWFPEGIYVQKFKVHSGQKHEKNQKELNGFNDSKYKISLLFCVDVLNEGVHVDDIDGVIMLRKTRSPIIYFQQIGRALSFSGRHKQIQILDLVNNFKHHNAINLVYEEYINQLNKRIEQEPERAEEYQKLKERFKIKNETEEIIAQLGEISELISLDNLYRERIDMSIEVLQRELEKNPKLNIFSKAETKDAYLTISKYAKNVDNEQFRKLIEFDIILPEEIAMTEEERTKILRGYKSIREKEKNACNDLVVDVIEFARNNGRNVRINTEDEREKELAMQYLYFLPKLDDWVLDRIDNAFYENNIPVLSYEKVLFERELTQEDIEDLINKSKRFLEKNQPIPEYISNAMKIVYNNYNINENPQIFELLEQSNEIKAIQNENKNKARYERLKNVISFLKENIELSFEELQKLDDYCLVIELDDKDKSYIKKQYRILKNEYYKGCMGNIIDTDLQHFCDLTRQINLENYKIVESKLNKEEHKNIVIRDYAKFVKNNGNTPNINSQDENEKKLAEEIQTLQRDGLIHEKILQIQEDSGSLLLHPEDVIREFAEIELSNIKIEKIILKNVKFVSINKRKPVLNSQDEEERWLAQEYNDEVITQLNEKQLQSLNKTFNGKKCLRNTCLEYIKNKGENR